MRDINFSPGPAALPQAVKNKLSQELQKPLSFFEISHRRPEVKELWQEAQQKLLAQLQLPEDYFCLLLPGGARLQIAHFWQRYASLLHWGVLLSGYWGRWSYQQGVRYASSVRPIGLLTEKSDFDGLYYCDNETLSGLSSHLSRAFDNQLLVVDKTSSLLTQPFLSQDGRPPDLIIAACQKNLGFSGASVVIGDKKFLTEAMAPQHLAHTPLDYALQAQMGGDACTPSVMHYWVLAAMLDWVQEQGGLQAIHQKRCYWAQKFYDIIDGSENFENKIPIAQRSMINVTFDLKKKARGLQEKFDQALQQAQCYAFRGHPAYSSGYRLSLYNSVSCLDLSSVCKVLADFS